jgi:hypothetical protein
MDPVAIAALAELAKLGLMTYMSYMKQAGLTDEQIDQVFQNAKSAMLARDPAKIPG